MLTTEASIMMLSAQAVLARTWALTHIPGTPASTQHGSPTMKYSAANDHRPRARRAVAASPTASTKAQPHRHHLTGTLAIRKLSDRRPIMVAKK